MSGLVVTAYGVPRSYPNPLLSVGWHKVGLVKIVSSQEKELYQ